MCINCFGLSIEDLEIELKEQQERNERSLAQFMAFSEQSLRDRETRHRIAIKKFENKQKDISEKWLFKPINCKNKIAINYKYIGNIISCKNKNEILNQYKLYDKSGAFSFQDITRIRRVQAWMVMRLAGIEINAAYCVNGKLPFGKCKDINNLSLCTDCENFVNNFIYDCICLNMDNGLEIYGFIIKMRAKYNSELFCYKDDKNKNELLKKLIYFTIKEDLCEHFKNQMLKLSAYPISTAIASLILAYESKGLVTIREGCCKCVNKDYGKEMDQLKKHLQIQLGKNEHMSAQYGEANMAVSHVWGQKVMLNRHVYKNKCTNVWVDVLQKEKFNAEKCKQEYNGPVIVIDRGILQTKGIVDRHIALCALLITDWSMRGWTACEFDQAHNIILVIDGGRKVINFDKSIFEMLKYSRIFGISVHLMMMIIQNIPFW